MNYYCNLLLHTNKLNKYNNYENQINKKNDDNKYIENKNN